MEWMGIEQRTVDQMFEQPKADQVRIAKTRFGSRKEQTRLEQNKGNRTQKMEEVRAKQIEDQTGICQDKVSTN